MSAAKKKIAILGGGVSAMTAAFELTQPALEGRYDVTVYQLGWRLGGKGASGRNKEIAERIEEHGLHIWMGFYDNAFQVMKQAYDELGRKSGPLQTWQDAFKQHSYIVLGEPLGGKEYFWQVNMPTNGLTPGEDHQELTIAEAAALLAEWSEHHWWKAGVANPPNVGGVRSEVVTPRVEALVSEAAAVPRAAHPPRGALGTGAPLPTVLEADARDPAAGCFARARVLARGVAEGTSAPSPETSQAIIALLRAGLERARVQIADGTGTNFFLFQLWVAINLGCAGLIGILGDDIISKGWDSIDGLDLREWLRKWGAESLTVNSGPIRGVYDLVFGYVDGDPQRPQFAAGTAMRGMLRMVFDYKGAIFYKMQAGMGDTVFTPLYQVLKNRGVRFEFFHKVDDITVDATTKTVASIELTKQVKLVNEGIYDPLRTVLGLPCWPSEPRYELIEHGFELEKSGINLESTWALPWHDAEKKAIHAGSDFDVVVLGISVGALEESASSLLQASPKLRKTFDEVKTVQTCAFQLWLKPDLGGLGWTDPPGISERPVLGAFVEPLDTWADMSQLLVRETWPVNHTPKNVAYFCGVFEQTAPLPPPTDHDFPARELARLDGMAKGFLNQSVGALWPATAAPLGFQWNMLVDVKDQTGDRRFDAQFRRVNVDPTERYVLSVPGSTQYRLPPDGTEFSNLVLTGDWTSCGLNAGCVEAAVTSGMRAAAVITGVTPPIRGVGDPTRSR